MLSVCTRSLLSFSWSNLFLMHLLSSYLPAEPPAESWQNSNNPSNTGQSSPTLTAKRKQSVFNKRREHNTRGADLWTGCPVDLWEHINSMPNVCCASAGDMVDSATRWGCGQFTTKTCISLCSPSVWCFHSHIPTPVQCAWLGYFLFLDYCIIE